MTQVLSKEDINHHYIKAPSVGQLGVGAESCAPSPMWFTSG